MTEKMPCDISMTLNCFHAHKASTHKNLVDILLQSKKIDLFVQSFDSQQQQQQKMFTTHTHTPKLQRILGKRMWLCTVYTQNLNGESKLGEKRRDEGGMKAFCKKVHTLTLIKAITKLCTPMFFFITLDGVIEANAFFDSFACSIVLL